MLGLRIYKYRLAWHGMKLLARNQHLLSRWKVDRHYGCLIYHHYMQVCRFSYLCCLWRVQMWGSTPMVLRSDNWEHCFFCKDRKMQDTLYGVGHSSQALHSLLTRLTQKLMMCWEDMGYALMIGGVNIRDVGVFVGSKQWKNGQNIFENWELLCHCSNWGNPCLVHFATKVIHVCVQILDVAIRICMQHWNMLLLKIYCKLILGLKRNVIENTCTYSQLHGGLFVELLQEKLWICNAYIGMLNVDC